MHKGFAFIELTVIVTIFSLLIAISIASFRYFQATDTLQGDAQKIVSTLRLAQSKAISSETEQNYGVFFDLINQKYILFSGDSYSVEATTHLTYNLSSRNKLAETNLNNSLFEVVFNHINGSTLNYGTIKITFTDDDSQLQIISINPTGETYLGIDGSLNLPAYRDSRHAHFTYDSNIKNAVILRLFFPDDNYTYDINFQNYLNTAKTEFSWQDTLTVSGQAQTLSVQTHSLTDLAAQFSIRRDARYNNKAVQLSIDGDNLINYQSNGSTTKGSSLFVSEPEWQ